MRFGKFTMLGLAAVAASAIGCSSNSTGSPSSKGGTTSATEGAITLDMTLPGGYTLNAITATVTPTGGGTARTESIPLDHSGRIQAIIGRLAAGRYDVNLSGATTNGALCTGSTATPVNVTVNHTETTSIFVTCQASGGAAANGSIEIRAEAGVVQNCGGIGNFQAIPSQVNVGSDINLVSDAGDAGAATYAWTLIGAGSAASFTTATNIASPTVHCAADGEFTARLTVTIPGCPTVSQDGTLTCGIPGGGTGGSTGAGGSTNTGGNTSTGGSTNTGGSTSSGGAPNAGGASSGGAPNAGGASSGGSTGTGGGTPGDTIAAIVATRGATCTSCFTRQCAGSSYPRCETLAGDNVKKCFDVVKCEMGRSSASSGVQSCAYAGGNALDCFCGLPNDDCGTVGPQFTAGAGITLADSSCVYKNGTTLAGPIVDGFNGASLATIFANYYDLSYPSGIASNFVQCIANYCFDECLP